PIERAFKDLCDSIAKHPAFAGAYTGNNPMAKPENYGSKAVDWDRFCAVAGEEIAEHNAQPGRRTEMAQGRSFDEAFAESYATAPIKKVVDPAVLRMALLAADQRLISKATGHLELEGNRYWHPQMFALRGELGAEALDPGKIVAIGRSGGRGRGGRGRFRRDHRSSFGIGAQRGGGGALRIGGGGEFAECDVHRARRIDQRLIARRRRGAFGQHIARDPGILAVRIGNARLAARAGQHPHQHRQRGQHDEDQRQIGGNFGRHGERSP
ncbi:hypothetical protein FKK50_26750, partial [Klebsiella pneumoniae]|nr:hypothetical protein [Klebsiella pneumoniae]